MGGGSHAGTLTRSSGVCPSPRCRATLRRGAGKGAGSSGRCLPCAVDLIPTKHLRFFDRRNGRWPKSAAGTGGPARWICWVFAVSELALSRRALVRSSRSRSDPERAERSASLIFPGSRASLERSRARVDSVSGPRGRGGRLDVSPPPPARLRPISPRKAFLTGSCLRRGLGRLFVVPGEHLLQCGSPRAWWLEVSTSTGEEAVSMRKSRVVIAGSQVLGRACPPLLALECFTRLQKLPCICPYHE